MVTMNISLNKELADFVDKEVKTKKYANRSEFFRHILRMAFMMSLPREEREYYKLVDHMLAEDWAGPENDNIFKTN